LKILSVFTDSAFDAIWQHLVEIDPEEIMHTRRLQKMHLSRYGRTPIFSWDNVDVTEIREWHNVLREVMSDENPMQTMMEDG
jgi:hypothetical protein